MKNFKYLAIAALIGASCVACSDDAPQTPPADYQEVDAGKGHSLEGLYVLNEGNMGANKATLDFLDFKRAFYIRNVYPERNPEIVMELGDTGNDLKIHNGRLYALLNGSHKVEVMDAVTTVRIGQIDVSNPRYITFDQNNAYITSYVGGDANHGSVVKVDLATLTQTATLSVGLSPEEMAIVDGKLYVANSADFNTGEFDSTITVIDLASFTVTGSITAAPNMQHLRADADGNLWVNSRGNYYDIPGSLVKLAKTAAGNYAIAASIEKPVSNFEIVGNKILYYATEYDQNWNAIQTFGTINRLDCSELGNFITDGTDSDIVTPYAIAVHPDTGDIYITDAKNYVSSGMFLCYSSDGKLKWSATTGDIPGHIALLKK